MLITNLLFDLQILTTKKNTNNWLSKANSYQQRLTHILNVSGVKNQGIKIILAFEELFLYLSVF